jgi:3-dehydroquinate synthase
MNIQYLNTEKKLINKIQAYYTYYDKIFIFTQNTILLHYEFIKNLNATIYICDDGESCKSIEQYNESIKYLHNHQCNKKSIIIGIGGGVITDFTGYVASTYMRGITHSFIPTSLLAMVDAAIGGKTALNTNGVRNLLGTYKNPNDVMIYTNFLKTLKKDDIINGCAEILKYSLIMDIELFDYLEKNISDIFPDCNIKIIQPIINKCINHKINIVTQDQYDLGIRNILNFGHTIGHALESYYAFKMPHGKAVLYGIIVGSYLSQKENILSEKSYNRIINLIKTFNLPSLDNLHTSKIMTFIHNDKKNIGNELNYILLKNIGEAIIQKNYNKKFIEEGLSIL